MNIIKRSEAKKLGLTHYYTGKPCTHGHLMARRVSDRVCMECDRVNKKKGAAENSEHYKAKKQASYIRNRPHILLKKREYRQNNKGAINALVAGRKKHIKLATPKWVDSEELWLIKEAYALAALRTKQFKFSWHVDHIVPLQGKLVSGLHTIYNLQVIPGVENLKKKNKHGVDNVY